MPKEDFLSGVEEDGPELSHQRKISGVNLDHIEPAEKQNLHIAKLNDSDLVTPFKVSELTEDTEPLIPLPHDAVSDIVYISRTEPRCVLCRCPFRVHAEHWYVQNAFRAMEVVRFFARHFGASISYEQVQNHMNMHCNLQSYNKRGLIQIATREEEISPYLYRERELANIGILMQIDELQGLDCGRDADLILKKSARLESLYKSLRAVAKERDEAGTEALNLFEILSELIKRMPDAETQQIIKDYVKELRRKLMKGTT